MPFEAIYIGNMESIQHKGEIVEAAIKQSGYQVKALARKLGIARNTLYLKLKNAGLDNSFIARIGQIIHYDFASAIKDWSSKDGACAKDAKMNYHTPTHKRLDYIAYQKLHNKYLQLLEDYNRLCKLLVWLANSNDVVGIKKEIAEFLEEGM